MLNNFFGYIWIVRKFKLYVMIEWCIDVLNEVYNDVKVRSRQYFQERKYRVEIVVRVY